MQIDPAQKDLVQASPTQGGSSRYRFGYAEDSLYGRVMSLVERHLTGGGLVVDIGCGWGAVAERCREIGLDYLGCDVDPEGLVDLSNRGFETASIDVSDARSFVESLHTQVKGRKVAAFFLLDVLEHLVTGEQLLMALATLAAAGPETTTYHGARLVMSVPNVAHYELAAKLLMGRFDVTPSGLLDDTHVVFYTGWRLEEVTRRAGWMEVARDDFVMYESDQRFPPEAAMLAPFTPLRRFLAGIRQTADGFAFVNQFVRMYTPANPPALAAPATEGVGISGDVDGLPSRPIFDKRTFANQVFATVLVRTTGSRMGTLHDTLLSLAAQSYGDFEVLVLCHNTPAQVFDAISNLVNQFSPTFSNRVKVVPVSGGGRSRPLNVGISLAKGRYTIILDDDDLAFPGWMAEFRRLADIWPGMVLRLGVAEQHMEDQPGPGGKLFYHATSRPRCPYPKKFDLLSHLHENRTPPCALAYPSSFFQYLGFRFGEDLPVLEDWDILIQAAELCGVADSPEVCTLYRHWNGGDQSTAIHPPAEWMETRQEILSRLESRPILLPPGYIREVHKLDDLERICHRLHSERTRLLAEVARARQQDVGAEDSDAGSARADRAATLASAVAGLDARRERPAGTVDISGTTPQGLGYASWADVAAALAAELVQVKSSKGWRLTEPVRAVGKAAHKLAALFAPRR
ncbi:MAG: glycosyltransferase family 2 protein [Actinobacteria bacterium]|nr:glycosyltransferase family 2 protein [Actinomycetota bacterium]